MSTGWTRPFSDECASKPAAFAPRQIQAVSCASGEVQYIDVGFQPDKHNPLFLPRARPTSIHQLQAAMLLNDSNPTVAASAPALKKTSSMLHSRPTGSRVLQKTQSTGPVHRTASRITAITGRFSMSCKVLPVNDEVFQIKGPFAAIPAIGPAAMQQETAQPSSMPSKMLFEGIGCCRTCSANCQGACMLCQRTPGASNILSAVMPSPPYGPSPGPTAFTYQTMEQTEAALSMLVLCSSLSKLSAGEPASAGSLVQPRTPAAIDVSAVIGIDPLDVLEAVASGPEAHNSHDSRLTPCQGSTGDCPAETCCTIPDCQGACMLCKRTNATASLTILTATTSTAMVTEEAAASATHKDCEEQQERGSALLYRLDRPPTPHPKPSSGWFRSSSSRRQVYLPSSSPGSPHGNHTFATSSTSGSSSTTRSRFSMWSSGALLKFLLACLTTSNKATASRFSDLHSRGAKHAKRSHASGDATATVCHDRPSENQASFNTSDAPPGMPMHTLHAATTAVVGSGVPSTSTVAFGRATLTTISRGSSLLDWTEVESVDLKDVPSKSSSYMLGR